MNQILFRESSYFYITENLLLKFFDISIKSLAIWTTQLFFLVNDQGIKLIPKFFFFKVGILVINHLSFKILQIHQPMLNYILWYLRKQLLTAYCEYSYHLTFIFQDFNNLLKDFMDLQPQSTNSNICSCSFIFIQYLYIYFSKTYCGMGGGLFLALLE